MNVAELAKKLKVEHVVLVTSALVTPKNRYSSICDVERITCFAQECVAYCRGRKRVELEVWMNIFCG